MLNELNVDYGKTPVVWVDNMSTIALASNLVLHARTKHIEIDAHFIRDKVKEKKIELRYVPSTDQIADLLTKPLGYQFFSRLRNKLGICSMSGIELRGSVNMVIQTEVPKEKPAKRICDATYPMSKIISSCATLEPMLAAPTWKEVLLGGIG